MIQKRSDGTGSLIQALFNNTKKKKKKLGYFPSMPQILFAENL